MSTCRCNDSKCPSCGKNKENLWREWEKDQEKALKALEDYFRYEFGEEKRESVTRY